MAKRKINFDMSVFISLASCKNQLADGNGGYCAQGKIMAACGLNPKNTKHFKKINDLFVEIMESHGWIYKPLGNTWSYPQIKGGKDGIKKHHVMNAGYRYALASHVNNMGHFQEADRLALQAVIESGRFTIINPIKEPVKTLKELQAATV